MSFEAGQVRRRQSWMLVVKVELWPGGDSAQCRELGRVAIGNLSGLSAISDYAVVIWDSDGERTAVVRGHERAKGFWPLVSRALSPRASKKVDGSFADAIRLMSTAMQSEGADESLDRRATDLVTRVEEVAKAEHRG